MEVAIRRARTPSALPPLVLVPGVGGPRETFYHQVEAFAADRDARGFQSGRPYLAR